ncbi:MAG: hypothetical protein H8E68_00200 [Kiritimatiellaeota bacterium]|nr:hypothetical protein [Kiritimatiellota bacterium]
MQIKEFLSRLKNVSKTSKGWSACCPAHDDQSPSLSITEGDDGRILIKCHAGCTTEQVVASLELSLSDLFPDSGTFAFLNDVMIAQKAKSTARYRSKQPMRQTSFHPYTKEGKAYAGVYRFDPTDGSDGKQYVPVHATPSGGAVGDPPEGWPLYNLEEIQQRPDDPVYLVEGEKAADALIKIGLLATTSAHGSNGWKKTNWSPLVGRDLIVMPDNDEPGGKYITDVANHMTELGGCATVQKVELTGFPLKADACELLDRLREPDDDADRIRTAVFSMAQEWSPEPSEISPEEQLIHTLTDLYGDPFACGAKGQPLSVNQQFVAGWCSRALKILFDPSTQSFYEYDLATGLWIQQTDASIIQRIGSELGVLLDLLDALRLRPKCGQAVLSAIMNLLKGMVEEQGRWSKQENTIHLENGMLKLHAESGPKLLEFSSDFYSRNRSDYPWVPDSECPRFIKALLSPALSADDILLLQKYAGQCLLGRNMSQTFLLIRGTSGGGKSTLCDVVENVIGLDNVAQLRVEQLTNRFESLRFLGRTLLSGKDVAGNFLDSKGAYVLKALVGGDRLEGEVKGGNRSFAIRGEYNSIIVSNSRLCVRLDGDAGAWQRRLLIIDFDQPSVEKPISDFADVLLEEEGPGILRWMIIGAIALLADLAEFGTIQLSDTQSKRVEDLLAESDSVRAFVRDCVEKADSHSDISVAELTAAYFDYCESRGWEARSRRRFETESFDVMMQIHRATRRNDIQRDGKNQRGYSGVQFACQLPAEGGETC